MGITKLVAGSGYEYLTRQVAAMDSTELGRMPLADYYQAKGEAPGQWMGSGLAGLGINAGDVVTSEQMGFLFGEGKHPLTADRIAALGPDATERAKVLAAKLGQKLPEFAATTTPYRLEVARRYDEFARPTACRRPPPSTRRNAPGSAPRSVSRCSPQSMDASR